MITTNKKRLMNFAGHIKTEKITKNLKWQKSNNGQFKFLHDNIGSN